MLCLLVPTLFVSDFNFSSFSCLSLASHSFSFLFLLKAVLLLLGILELVMLSDETFSFSAIIQILKKLNKMALYDKICNFVK